MPSATERQQINRFLGRAGLAQLDAPALLIQQMATIVQDHDHFRRMLAKCEPEQRYAMYEALAPRLRFRAKPLGDYMIESARIAEEQQYPTIDEAGNLHPFEVPEFDDRTEAEIAEAAIAKAMRDDAAKQRLWLVCRKCTFEDVFTGTNRPEAIQAARNAGWTYDEIDGLGREICPKCP